LPEGEALAIHLAKIMEGCYNVIEAFPQAQHQARFGWNSWSQFPGRGEQP
jgi:hypothetical protein